MPFNIGLSGLNAAAADLKVTGNNISNSGTIGFKESRAEFANVFAHSYSYINKTAIGNGVRLAATPQQFHQGGLEYTQNGMDLAINGDGFFVIRDEVGQDRMNYTRAGAFQVDRDGYVVNSAGQRLQAYPPKIPGSTSAVFDTGKLDDLKLPLDTMAPKATTAVDAQFNLNADEPVPTTAFAFGGSDPDPTSYNWSTTYTVYDSLGKPRDATMYFRKTNANTWGVYVGMRNAAGVMGDKGSGATTLTFNSAGKYLSGGPIAVTAGPFTGIGENGAAALAFSIDMSKSTQYHASRNTLNDLIQDGYSTGTLSGFDVDAAGVVFSRYSNGQSQILGQVAMANFKNAQGLQQLGENNWTESFGSGPPIYGAPGDARLGAIQSGAIETSNVNLTEELVNLITAQRNYEANAKTISTADQMTQTILNIR